jgi:hypothetical protein
MKAKFYQSLYVEEKVPDIGLSRFEVPSQDW